MNIFPGSSFYEQWLDYSKLQSIDNGKVPFFPELAQVLHWPETVNAAFGKRTSVLKQLGVQAGDYLVLPNLNALAWAEAAATLGADCIIIDHHPDHWQIDLDLLEEFLMNFTMLNELDDLVLKKDSRRLRAVIIPHLLGGMCDMDRLTFIATRFNLALGEDISQALGSSRQGKPAGSFGQISFCEFRSNPVVPFGQSVLLSTQQQTESGEKTKIYPSDRFGNLLGRQLIPQVPNILEQLCRMESNYREQLSDLQFNWKKPLPEVKTNGLGAAFTSKRELHAGAVPLHELAPSTLHHALAFQKSLYIRREDWSTQIFQSAWILPLTPGDEQQLKRTRAALFAAGK